MSFVDEVSGTSTSQITAGTTVQWVFQSLPHSTTSGTCNASNCFPGPVSGENWNYFPVSLPASFTYTFNNVGFFTYFCNVHNVNMQGFVNVTAPPAPAQAVRR